MNDKLISLYFDLLRYSVFDKSACDKYKEKLNENEINALFRLGKKHDVAHLIAYAIDSCGLVDKEQPIHSVLQKEYMLAVYRNTKMRVEYENICTTLREACIPFIPLKGSVIRKYYPEPWMRTSCDIDILVHASDTDIAASELISKLGFERGERGTHDISLYSKSGVHLELHFNLNEPVGKCYDTLEKIWEYSSPAEDGDYLYQIRGDAFYFYHVAHMAKHFMNGGCGIRPFIDLVILCRNTDVCSSEALLEAEGLSKFNEAVRRLAGAWFLDLPHDGTTLKMQNYVLSGGVYGNIDNKVRIHSGKRGGKFRYILSRIFMPYSQLKVYYPVLQRCPILTPIFQVVRWFKFIFKKKKSTEEIKASSSLSSAESRAMAEFLDEIGL